MTELTFKLAADDSVTVNIDTDMIHADTIERLVNRAATAYVNNRVASAKSNYERAVKAYEADPTTTEPTAPDYAAVAGEAKADLMNNTMRTRGDGSKPKATKDPLDAVVTTVVCKDLFKARHAKDRTIKFGTITKEVSEAGGGIAYLRAIAGDDTDKLKKIESKYLAPARKMLGVNAKGEALEPESDELL